MLKTDGYLKTGVDSISPLFVGCLRMLFIDYYHIVENDSQSREIDNEDDHEDEKNEVIKRLSSEEDPQSEEEIQGLDSDEEIQGLNSEEEIHALFFFNRVLLLHYNTTTKSTQNSLVMAMLFVVVLQCSNSTMLLIGYTLLVILY